MASDVKMVARDAARSLEFEFIKQLSKHTWLVRRKEDRASFLAWDVTEKVQEKHGGKPWALHWLLEASGPQDGALQEGQKGRNLMFPLMRILNHENLINIINRIDINPIVDGLQPNIERRVYCVMDFCNASTLENLFYKPSIPTETPGSEPRPQPNCFLPESLCWHVVTSVLTALTWLHHGIREEFNPEKEEYERIRVDVDWHTILHRNIEPSTIFFCHPQASESYGLCKLGDLSKAFVSGRMNGVPGLVEPANTNVMTSRRGNLSLEKLRKLDATMKHSPGIPRGNWNLYTMTDEYKALGHVILAMMVKPSDDAQLNAHFGRVQKGKADQMLHQVEYTISLKNMVKKLLSHPSKLGELSTCELQEEAAFKQEEYYRSKDETLTTIESQLILQHDYKARVNEHNENCGRQTEYTIQKQDEKMEKERLKTVEGRDGDQVEGPRAPPKSVAEERNDIVGDIERLVQTFGRDR